MTSAGFVSNGANAGRGGDAHHPFSATRRPMAGSGSLSGDECDEGPPSARIAIEQGEGCEGGGWGGRGRSGEPLWADP